MSFFEYKEKILTKNCNQMNIQEAIDYINASTDSSNGGDESEEMDEVVAVGSIDSTDWN